MSQGRDYVTIRPAPETLISGSTGDPPAPLFIIECGPRTRRLAIEVEIGSHPDAFSRGSLMNFPGDYFNSREEYPNVATPEIGLHVERGGQTSYQVPLRVWARFVDRPRIYYRVTGRYLYD